eukprot:4359779-Amphidinium_carterae.1
MLKSQEKCPKNGKQTKNGKRPFLKKLPLVAVLFFFPRDNRQKAKSNAHFGKIGCITVFDYRPVEMILELIH